MKAPKQPLYKTRGITFQELGALLGTREMLVRKILSGQGERVFDMSTACDTHGLSCGTASCIGGTMAMLMGVSPLDYVREEKQSPHLRSLFFPPIEYGWNTITAKQGIAAIDNWLKTGDPKWEKILKKSQLEV